MRREIVMFPTMLRIGFADLLAYRAQVLIWILTTTMPLIMYGVWSSLSDEAPVGRYDSPTFAAYFLSTLVVRQLSSSWVVWEMNENIRSGQLSMTLLRPVHPLLFYAAENLGALPFRVLVLVPIVVLGFVLLPDMPIRFEPALLFWYLWSTLLAWLLTFSVQAMVALTAFYTAQSLSLQELWFGLWAIFSGYLFPLELLPGLHAVAVWLPFRSLGSLPTEILLGHLSPRELYFGLLVQVGWVVVVLLTLRLWWDRALRRFEAFGA